MYFYVKVADGGVGLTLNEVRSDTQEPYLYFGAAPDGSEETDTVWTVSRIDTGVNPFTVEEATGVAWTDRTTAVYS